MGHVGAAPADALQEQIALGWLFLHLIGGTISLSVNLLFLFCMKFPFGSVNFSTTQPDKSVPVHRARSRSAAMQPPASGTKSHSWRMWPVNIGSFDVSDWSFLELKKI